MGHPVHISDFQDLSQRQQLGPSFSQPGSSQQSCPLDQKGRRRTKWNTALSWFGWCAKANQLEQTGKSKSDDSVATFIRECFVKPVSYQQKWIEDYHRLSNSSYTLLIHTPPPLSTKDNSCTPIDLYTANVYIHPKWVDTTHSASLQGPSLLSQIFTIPKDGNTAQELNLKGLTQLYPSLWRESTL